MSEEQRRWHDQRRKAELKKIEQRIAARAGGSRKPHARQRIEFYNGKEKDNV